MKLHHVLIPISLVSLGALAGVASIGPDFIESSPAVIRLDPETGMPQDDRPSVVVGESDIAIDPETGFAVAAFPPTIPDREWHQNAWLKNNCLDCHETGVGDAPMIRHKGLPRITYQSKCRSCHVLIPGKTDYVPKVEESPFESWAFPPMLPNNDNHAKAWGKRDCLMCHESGVKDAPVVKHEGLPRLTLRSKCRTCHVQIRSQTTSPWDSIEIEPNR
jgi:Cytochrome c554 and c-prime